MITSVRRAAWPLVALALAASAPARAQETDGIPDRRGEAYTAAPAFRGVKANAPIPSSMHIRNEGGSDGAGLCVISSLVINGRYQRVPGLEGGKNSQLWKAAKAAPGGYYPEKLEKLLARTLPGEKYVSHTGTDPKILIELSRRGYPVGMTWKTGRLYNYAPIHHMVSGIHFDRRFACIVDNNKPGVYSWLPFAEAARRWIDGASGWAFWWTRLPRRSQRTPAVTATILIMTLCLATLPRRRPRSLTRC